MPRRDWGGERSLSSGLRNSANSPGQLLLILQNPFPMIFTHALGNYLKTKVEFYRPSLGSPSGDSSWQGV